VGASARIDPILDLADLLVIRLAALASELSTPAAFTVAWQSNPVQDLADKTLYDPVVWVTDFGATVQTDNNGIILEEFELLVIVQRRLAKFEVADDVCREMSALTAAISNYCRKTILDPEASGNGAVCYRIERERSRDFRQWHEANLYRAELSTHWRRMYTGDEQ
jgi:hypothetical protein